MADDEFRVEVNLDDPEHGFGLGERLRARHLDDETRERLGNRVMVTRDGPRLFLYTTTQDEAHAAEGVIRELIEQDDLSAEVRTTRWHPDEEAWEDASHPLPTTDKQRAAERKRHAGHDWEVRIELTGLATAVELERDLIDEGSRSSAASPTSWWARPPSRARASWPTASGRRCPRARRWRLSRT